MASGPLTPPAAIPFAEAFAPAVAAARGRLGPGVERTLGPAALAAFETTLAERLRRAAGGGRAWGVGAGRSLRGELAAARSARTPAGAAGAAGAAGGGPADVEYRQLVARIERDGL